jgi:microcystin-dependent protein
MPFAGDCTQSAVSASLLAQGWLPCWGQLVSINDYPDLEGYIANLYGGDNVTNIALPDLRGRFIRGAGPGTGAIAAVQPYATAYPTTGALALDTAGVHTHTFDNVPAWDNHSDRCNGHSTYNWNGGTGPTSGPLPNATHSHNVATGGDTESRPINLYVDYIIKVIDVAPPPRRR